MTPTPTTAAPDPVRVAREAVKSHRLSEADIAALPPDISTRECWAFLGARAMQEAMSAQGGGEVVAWRIQYADGSGFLVFTEDEADEVIADARPGATKHPLYATPPTPSTDAVRRQAREEALEEAARAADSYAQWLSNIERQEAAKGIAAGIRALKARALSTPPAGAAALNEGEE